MTARRARARSKLAIQAADHTGRRGSRPPRDFAGPANLRQATAPTSAPMPEVIAIGRAVGLQHRRPFADHFRLNTDSRSEVAS
jgi:hypothetical protein